MKPDDYYRQLASELKSMEDTIRELKNRQPNGNDTVQTYQNKQAGWDIDWTPTWAGGGSRSLNKSILFQAEQQDAPVNRMRYEILVDNSLVYTLGSFDDPFAGKVAVLGYVHDTFLSYTNLSPAPGLDAWYFNVTCYVSGTNIKVRFIIDSTDVGTITMEDV